MTYLQFMLGTAALLLALAATVNVLVDPAGIYRARSENPDTYVDALVASAHGLWWPENLYDERSLKKALARYSQRADCVVIGSSHAMQVSSIRPKNSLSEYCESILNLAVSGASIEDHITLAYLTLAHGRPGRIVLGADPWIFAFGKDARWSQYKGDYFQARDAVIGKKSGSAEKSDSVWQSKLKNLVSFEYTVRSVRKALQDLKSSPPSIAAAPELNANIGGEYPALLPDGSLLYSAEYIATSGRVSIPLGGITYKTDGPLNHSYAINVYRSLLLWIMSKGVEPVVLLTPYHENVGKSPNSPTAVALRAVEPVIRALARELNVKVIGSYDPHIAGCLVSDFYDAMHPTRDCLAKLRIHGIPHDYTGTTK